MRVATLARVLGAGAGGAGPLGSVGVRFMIGGDESGGGFALVEHPMPPRALAAPLHRHRREDEYSYVLEGWIGAELGEEVVSGTAMNLVVKPRGQGHTFWNTGDDPARLLEFVPPAGFERYFAAMTELPLAAGPPDLGAIAAVAARFELELDFASVPRLVQEHGITLGAGAP